MSLSDQEHESEPPADLALIDRDEALTIHASDGYPLAARLLTPTDPNCVVLILSGTGFAKEFYLNFAKAGVARGAACLLVDFRGAAASRPEQMRGFKGDHVAWGRLDLPAVIAFARDRFPGLPVRALGHSAGGFILGFAPNHAELERAAMVCCGSGYWAHHFLSNRPLELFFWWGYGPACLAWFGYIPKGGVWGAEALPKDLFVNWRRWSNHPRYWLDELKSRLRPHVFDEVTTELKWFSYTDDPIATRRTTPVLQACYPNAPKTESWFEPGDYGLKTIGHSGVFRRAARPAWADIWDWLLR